MEIKEKVLEIMNKTIAHLKAIRKLQDESERMQQELGEELEQLLYKDKEVQELSVEMGELINEVGF
ncbi:hypothetical protein [Capnocytophaga felis]|uniref:Uncharacterized protein n=1 Tax=Capnocytophaga felis TaxID=2267611 RepID=A0A5M4BA45_9FLAO|nr:hypothetical protein [Capnocytophaga felis]GET46478.1 hypothetical protein RCZ01_17800 [Capnocytophaga felis]GET48368.1 hypothetical protein RCZ02_11990 [Capnocytophaga felis]